MSGYLTDAELFALDDDALRRALEEREPLMVGETIDRLVRERGDGTKPLSPGDVAIWRVWHGDK